jgi:hypothetical protein
VLGNAKGNRKVYGNDPHDLDLDAGDRFSACVTLVCDGSRRHGDLQLASSFVSARSAVRI